MDEKSPLISVIVPVYNTEPYLARCLDSILAQDETDFEILAVDDGSPDNSGAILEDYAARDGRVRPIHRENGGLSAARNTGMDHARGALFAFVDSDDFVTPVFLSSMLRALRETDADIASCGYVNEIGEKRLVYEVPEIVTLDPKTALSRMCYNDGYYVTTWDKLYKRELFDGVRFPEGKLFEDTATTFRLTDKAKRVALAPGIGYHYVTSPNSITTGKWSPKKMDYLEAADAMTDYIEQKYPDLKRACDRKRVHAAFSTLMQLVNSGVRDRAVEKELIGRIRPLRRGVFFDPRAPRRDKAAILSLFFGFPAFAAAWKAYRRLTGRAGK
ncbi:MAG: glycosyltransferase family 2 protein [Clostridia bacterium]|nr:glycosyltransferase family 2 protein [Clostridia bacterium]